MQEAPFLKTTDELRSWCCGYTAIALTNGCFDMLHAGHVECLLAAHGKAAELGMPLLVAVNSDASVARLKGAGRPINELKHRVKVLCALRCASAVTWFDADTPYELILQVRPMLLVKAEDYKGIELVGEKFVKSIGGKVWLAPYLQGVSTSAIVRSGGTNG
jgi:D-beta-D-heptose 7-phosphate kinase/D-beta-D-heptose 1-phosphate adenosyltransferase